MNPFQVGRQPRIVYGAGSRARIPELAASHGRRLLLVTGARSLAASPHWKPLADAMGEKKLAWVKVEISGEPSPDAVDAAVAEHRDASIDAVVGIGGGSALDAAKAIAGLLRTGRSVLDHLEDVGRGVPYEGPAVPWIAVPTTAGTGSEATRNAVLSVRGPKGFKKSFRDDRLVAQVAVVDPDLLSTCPPSLIAADGMDALTQLLESYASRRASPYTDALCESGLAAAREGLLAWHAGAQQAPAARAKMAYAALVSGITLAQAGLGAVHGFAQPLGVHTDAPHGAVCGALLAPATARNVARLREDDSKGPALAKYARACEILAPGKPPSAEALVGLLEDWTRRLGIPRLSTWGVTTDAFPRIVAGSRNNSMRSNPADLSDADLAAILADAL